MPETEITIGGRKFTVSCQQGEEHFLQSAAKLLDIEASVLTEQIGRLPEPRLLLMSGLMLADKTAGLEEKLQDAQRKLSSQQALLDEMRASAGADAGSPAAHKAMTTIASRTESLADKISEKLQTNQAG